MTDYFKSFTAHWSTKTSGEKPTPAMWHNAVALGCRPGKQAMFIAMCQRDGGATVNQFITAAKAGPAHNKRRELEAKKLIKVTTLPVEGAGNVYAYVVTITDKGKQAIAAFEAKAAEPAEPKAKKAKGKAKAKAKGGSKRKPAAPAAETTATADVGGVDAERAAAETGNGDGAQADAA